MARGAVYQRAARRKLLCLLGNRAKRYRFIEKVFAEGFSYLEGLPKIDDGSHRTLCFFTDELDTEIGTEHLCVDEYHLANARWYITVDNSCFAEEVLCKL